MSTVPYPSSIHLSRPLYRRFLEQLAEAWRVRAERRAEERRLQGIADMDAALLRDIGAPDWMVANAAERRARAIDHLRGLK